MGTWEIILMAGVVMLVAPLLGIMFMIGRSFGERTSAREYVGGLEAQRSALARQRHALEQQRAHLEEQREHLEERRRTPRVDDDPTREVRLPGYVELPNLLNKRRHRRYDEQ